MPKQGKFASSQRVRQVNDFHQKHPAYRQRTITGDQFDDFLLVRFALTTKKRLPTDSRESLQRFLQEFSPRIRANNGNVTQSVQQLLVELRPRVPWQFFWQVSTQWELFQHFIKREVPAVPLAKRLGVANLLSAADFDSLLADSLAAQVVALTTLKAATPPQIKRVMVTKMRHAIFDGSTINWEKIRALWAPFPFDVSSAPDEKTRQWLLALRAK